MESKRGIFICDKIPNLPQASLLWLYAMTGINKDYCSRGLREEAMRGEVAKGAVRGKELPRVEGRNVTYDCEQVTDIV
ncbi:hypothetical protein LOK49_LG07G01867 [Camellia lanceoleosa]|uniref:Uncharacterized protein n=1 Tax=Camellia lanceoleosa TaxID=1840588 RepID=A0ACC0H741_9ERIC|nr:hypothetical protein LOK49_LG07G01867 [Camellia lanceoleosa]